MRSSFLSFGGNPQSGSGFPLVALPNRPKQGEPPEVSRGWGDPSRQGPTSKGPKSEDLQRSLKRKMLEKSGEFNSYSVGSKLNQEELDLF